MWEVREDGAHTHDSINIVALSCRYSKMTRTIVLSGCDSRKVQYDEKHWQPELLLTDCDKRMERNVRKYLQHVPFNQYRCSTQQGTYGRSSTYV